MESGKTKSHSFALCFLLSLVTLAVFWPVTRGQFINYDDPTYVLENSHLKSGLSWQTVRWAFTSGYAGNWHPLTWLSHALDVQLYGLNPMGHHLTNLLFHAANAALIFLLLRRLTGALWRSAFVALIFALHPLRVESVAWIAERKDVLSGFFGLLALWAYTRHVTGDGCQVSGGTSPDSRFQISKSKIFYGLALFFFALGLMSKPMLVTWPFVLLLLDYWPLKRFTIYDLQLGSLFWRKFPSSACRWLRAS